MPLTETEGRVTSYAALAEEQRREDHMNRRLREIREQLESQNWTYEGVDGAGHPRFKSPEGKGISLAATPSDWRSVNNEVARLRRMGAIIKSKRGRPPAKVRTETNGHAADGLHVALTEPVVAQKPQTNRQRVRGVVDGSNRPMTAQEIASRLGLPMNSITPALAGLRAGGDILAVGREVHANGGLALLYLGRSHTLTERQRRFAEERPFKPRPRTDVAATESAPEPPATEPAPEPAPEPIEAAVAIVQPSHAHGLPRAFWKGLSMALLDLAGAVEALAGEDSHVHD